MHAWTYEIGAILIITHNGIEQPARVAGYVDSLNDDKPLYVNLRVTEGLRWGERKVKIQPAQIIREDKEWEARRHAQWEAELKAHCDALWEKMSDAEKQLVHKQAIALGLSRKVDRRSPLDIMIDRACGLD